MTLSIHYTERDIATQSEGEGPLTPGVNETELSLRWSARLSLTTRILAVNIFAIALLAGSLFYLDNYRDRLTEERLAQAELQSLMIGEILRLRTMDGQETVIAGIARHLTSRIRVYDASGLKVFDSFALAKPTYRFIDPQEEPFRKDIARFLDRSIEFVVGAETITPYAEPKQDTAASWDILERMRGDNRTVSAVKLADDRTPVILAATALPDGRQILLSNNARDITRIVRAERGDVVLVIFFAALVSILLSLFLARTIVRPIGKLARAAIRVRLGREPEITVPRMPERRDEIGQLARALSDMSGALRSRIDATEAFAADVSHEIKNPLASLRSALEGVGTVKKPELQKQLLDVANDDVRRIDRLINDISEASRVDAELARTKFDRVDIGKMLDSLLASRESRDQAKPVKIAYARPGSGVAIVMGDDGRLERVFSNILDNAVSFSPPDGLIEISATRDADEVIVQIEDEGPGVAPPQRSKIFTRFHSDRPDDEAFGRHSGLGLAIAKTIIEGHEGDISVIDKPGGGPGACFEIRLPRADINGFA